MSIRRIFAVGIVAIGCATTASVASYAPVKSGLRVELTAVPSTTPSGAAIYLAGSFNGWRPGLAQYQLKGDGKGRYSLDLPDTLRGPIEFKFTLGSWETVEIDSDGGDVPNRRYTVGPGRMVYTGRVSGWRNPRNKTGRISTARPSVSVIDTAFTMPQLGRTRRIWLYLPSGYSTSSKRYPVLYMHDGQNLFDAATSFAGEWGVDESLDSLAAMGDPGVIVVAVDHGGDKRLDELSPWPNPRYGGGEGDKYVDFLVKTLKPYIDAHYRTLPDRVNTAVAGSSMGGLISLYAALEYPEVFAKAGVFSPALWFNTAIYSIAGQPARVRPDVRFYFVGGGTEGATGEESLAYVKDQARMIEVLEHAGLREESNLRSVIQPDGKHSEWFWRREFPKAYVWLFAKP